MQFVGYETDTGDGPAALLVAEDDTVRAESLRPGRVLEFSLGDRHCAGVIDDDSHRSCSAGPAPYCPQHTSTWACARCTGDCSMPLPSCHEEHAVYLAAFAPDIFKVGVTRSWRLETRLREQGADRAAHIRTVEDGRRARQIEAGIAQTMSDRVRVSQKVAGIHQSVDADAWNALLADFNPIEVFDFDYGLDLDSQPVPETVATGTVRGTQGRVLVLDRGGTTYAVNMRDLVGYEVTPDASRRDLQSSLGAFN